jgi:hypothetical protein
MGNHELFATPAVIAVLLSTVALLAVFLVANGIAAWYEERTKRAGAVVRKGGQLPSGFGTFRGVAQNLDARSGGELARRERTEVSTQGPNGPFWRTISAETTGRTFVLVLESGAEIEVEARDARLVGFAETSPGAYTSGPGQAPRRAMIARISAGDEVWATGVLARPAAGGAGAYRSNLSRRKLRAPRRGELELSHESPVARWATLAKAHKRGAFTALGAVALLHGLFFRAVDQVLFRGRCVIGEDPEWTLQRVKLGVQASAALVVVAVAAVWIVGVVRAKDRARRS